MNKKWVISGGAVFIVVSLFAISNKSNSNLTLAQGSIKKNNPNMVAIKVSEDGVNYTSQKDIPIGNYTLNTEKSKCRIPDSSLNGENAPEDNSVTIEYTDGKLNFLGLTKNDTKCYVYFDKVQDQTSSSIIAEIEASSSFKTGTPTFSTISTTDEGIYKVADGMYGGSSYYWRGAATTNHVIFDSKCWRIVRINGDKTIRLIYNGTPSGTTCPGNGSNSSSVVLSGTAYNGSYDNSSYVGWTYTLNSQRTTSGTASNAKTQTEKWYKEHISEAAKAKVDTAGKFCNDRNTKNNETWRATGSTQYYAGYVRIYETIQPTLECPSGDVYSLSVGAITADEVMFAGGKPENNTSYYLYTGQNYWTMSPFRWNSGNARVFIVSGSDGRLGGYYVHDASRGLRPVINLKSDTLFAVGGNGTSTNPYVVEV